MLVLMKRQPYILTQMDKENLDKALTKLIQNLYKFEDITDFNIRREFQNILLINDLY